jgi:hypothetical protein
VSWFGAGIELPSEILTAADVRLGFLPTTTHRPSMGALKIAASELQPVITFSWREIERVVSSMSFDSGKRHEP